MCPLPFDQTHINPARSFGLPPHNALKSMALVGVGLHSLDELTVIQAGKLLALEATFMEQCSLSTLALNLDRPTVIVVSFEDNSIGEVAEDLAVTMFSATQPIGLIAVNQERQDLHRLMDLAPSAIRKMAHPLSYSETLMHFIYFYENLFSEKFIRSQKNEDTVKQFIQNGLKREKFHTFCSWLRLIRKARESFFPVEWLSDPIWDIMIALALAKLEGRITPVSNIGLEANVPVSTALRKLKEIEAQGFVNRWPDPKDKRREYVELSELGLQKFSEFVEVVWDRCAETGFM